jgi:hypothetical protein
MYLIALYLRRCDERQLTAEESRQFNNNREVFLTYLHDWDLRRWQVSDDQFQRWCNFLPALARLDPDTPKQLHLGHHCLNEHSLCKLLRQLQKSERKGPKPISCLQTLNASGQTCSPEALTELRALLGNDTPNLASLQLSLFDVAADQMLSHHPLSVLQSVSNQVQVQFQLVGS